MNSMATGNGPPPSGCAMNAVIVPSLVRTPISLSSITPPPPVLRALLRGYTGRGAAPTRPPLQAGYDREAEHEHQPVLERTRDEGRKECPSREVRHVRRRQLAEHWAQQRGQRVVAEERGEQIADRRQCRQLVG